MAALLVLCPFLVGATPSAGAEFEPEGPRPQTAQRLLVGIITGGQEVATIEVEFDGYEFLLPLEAFLGFCECELSVTRSGREILTPLGAVQLLEDDTFDWGKTVYIRESTLYEKLSIRVLYDQARFALVLDIPWLGRARGPVEGKDQSPPDVEAPSASISSATLRLRHSRQASRRVSTGNLTAFGRVADGLWRVRYDDDFGSSRSVSEYGWMRRVGEDKLFMLGHQQVGLHPLLSTIEVTGAQAAWTNQPLDLFTTGLRPTELLPRRLQPRTTISGLGVPAGTAVLRINDVAVAAQTIGLDGIYEFIEVPLQASQSNRIEVLVYGRYNRSVPIDIQDHSRNASDFLLPGGAIVAQAGGGLSGNAVQPQFSSGGAGFFQTRYGVSDRFTAETVVQSANGLTQAAVGGIFQPNPWAVVSFGGATSNGALSYQVDASYQRDDWRAQLLSRTRQEGFLTPDQPFDTEQYLEASRRFSNGSLEVGLIGRYRTGLQTVKFVLPTLAWRPSYRLFLRARPDFQGSYRIDGSWSPNRYWQVGASRARNITSLELARSINRALRVSALGEIRDDGGSRFAGLVSWYGNSGRALGFSGGPLVTNGRIGAVLSAQAQVLPGVLLGAQYETHSLVDRPDAAYDHRVTLNLTSNMSFSGGLMPGGLTASPYRRGGLAGRLIVAGGYLVPARLLEGLTVRIDRLTTVRTQAGGRFRVSNLKEGIYRVRLVVDGLPIELNPRRSSMRVEVVAGAVTRADFILDVEFGLAGRVRVNGEAVAGARVELVNDRDHVVQDVLSDQFGLYRIDGVGIGRYTVRLSRGNAPDLDLDWPSRRIDIVDDFLFDQDLSLTIERERPRDDILRSMEQAAREAEEAHMPYTAPAPAPEPLPAASPVPAGPTSEPLPGVPTVPTHPGVDDPPPVDFTPPAPAEVPAEAPAEPPVPAAAVDRAEAVLALPARAFVLPPIAGPAPRRGLGNPDNSLDLSSALARAMIAHYRTLERFGAVASVDLLKSSGLGSGVERLRMALTRRSIGAGAVVASFAGSAQAVNTAKPVAEPLRFAALPGIPTEHRATERNTVPPAVLVNPGPAPSRRRRERRVPRRPRSAGPRETRLLRPRAPDT